MFLLIKIIFIKKRGDLKLCHGNCTLFVYLITQTENRGKRGLKPQDSCYVAYSSLYFLNGLWSVSSNVTCKIFKILRCSDHVRKWHVWIIFYQTLSLWIASSAITQVLNWQYFWMNHQHLRWYCASFELGSLSYTRI